LAIRDYGAAASIPAASFEAHIASLVIKALDSFSRNVWSRGTRASLPLRGIGISEGNTFPFSVEQLRQDRLLFGPCTGGNGYVALSGEAVAISGNEVEEALPAAIREAFGKAT